MINNFFSSSKKYLVIIAAFGLSFLISNYASKNIFIVNSPKINPFYLANLSQQIKTGVNNIYLAISFKKTKDEKSNYANVSPYNIPEEYFKSVSKGVSAYEKKEGEIIFKIDSREISVKQREIEVNGRKVKVIDLTGE